MAGGLGRTSTSLAAPSSPLPCPWIWASRDMEPAALWDAGEGRGAEWEEESGLSQGVTWGAMADTGKWDFALGLFFCFCFPLK